MRLDHLLSKELYPLQGVRRFCGRSCHGGVLMGGTLTSSSSRLGAGASTASHLRVGGRNASGSVGVVWTRCWVLKVQLCCSFEDQGPHRVALRCRVVGVVVGTGLLRTGSGGFLRGVGWVSGGGGGRLSRPFLENCTVDASIFVVKLVRAHGGCLGTRSR